MTCPISTAGERECANYAGAIIGALAKQCGLALSSLGSDNADAFDGHTRSLKLTCHLHRITATVVLAICQHDDSLGHIKACGRWLAGWHAHIGRRQEEIRAGASPSEASC